MKVLRRMKKMTPTGFLLVLAISTAVWATPSAQDVSDAQKQLQHAQQQLKQQQSAQQQLKQDIQHTQTALKHAQTQLQQVTQQQAQSAEQLAQLQLRLSQLHTQNQHNKAQAQRLLNSQYKNKQPEAVVLLLQNSNPNDKGRHLTYLRYLNRANEQVLQDLKQQIQQIQTQEQHIAKEQAKLKALQQQSQQLTQRLDLRHQQQTKQNALLQQQIAQQQNHVATLTQNEKRLQALLTRLNRQQASKQTKTAPNPTASVKTESASTQASNALTSEDLALNAPQTPSQTPVNVNRFSHMQGSMPLPAHGSITGRFGAARDGGGTWKGILIATDSSPVQAVAEGQVVYAGALEGYGNTVIIDHGQGYVTVYAGLSSVGIGSGQSVIARSRLGQSGQLPSGEKGLYFEVRYQTRAMNPLSWVG